MRILLSFIFAAFSISLHAQQIDCTLVNTDTVYTHVEQMPEFPGGDAALLKYFRETSFLKDSLPDNWQTKIVIRFTVLTDGTTANHAVVKGVDMVDNNKLVAIFNRLPLFVPGKYLGKPVNVNMILPIIIELDK